jgi:sulfur transfer protein SufE
VVACSGKTCEEVLALDIRGLLGRLDLSSHLSPLRSTSLHAAVERMQALARDLGASSPLG